MLKLERSLRFDASTNQITACERIPPAVVPTTPIRSQRREKPKLELVCHPILVILRARRSRRDGSRPELHEPRQPLQCARLRFIHALLLVDYPPRKASNRIQRVVWQAASQSIFVAGRHRRHLDVGAHRPLRWVVVNNTHCARQRVRVPEVSKRQNGRG